MPENQLQIQCLFAWRFANPDGTSEYQRVPQEVGVKYTLGPGHRPIIGNWGFHGAASPLRALWFGQRFGIERIALSGEVVTSKLLSLDGTLLAAATERTTLWRADAACVLLGFVADCAVRATDAVLVDCPGASVPTESGRTWDALVHETTGHIHRYVAGQMDAAEVKAAFSCVMADRPKTLPGRMFNPLRAAIDGLAACHRHANKDARGWESAPFLVWTCFERCELTFDNQDVRAGREVGQSRVAAERAWQNDTLHARLNALAPTGYSEEAPHG